MQMLEHCVAETMFVKHPCVQGLRVMKLCAEVFRNDTDKMI